MTLTPAEQEEKSATPATIRVDEADKVIFLEAYKRYFYSFPEEQRRRLRMTHGTFVTYLCEMFNRHMDERK